MMVRKRILLIILLIVSYFFIPDVIHRVMRVQTSDEKIMINRKKYESLKQQSALSSLEQSKIDKEVDSLYLWFHVRGLPIDEGHFELSSYEKWKEICLWSRL